MADGGVGTFHAGALLGRMVSAEAERVERGKVKIINILYGGFIAFSMYSKIPMPQIAWKEERMRYALCWFPAVGMVCGAVLWLWLRFAAFWEIHPVTAGCVGAALPVLLTGGIHLDGLMDTLDARSSYAEKERKLEILKDPHLGAFAVLGVGVYALLYLGAMVQLYADGSAGQWWAVTTFCLVFSLERAFSGLSVVCFPCAKNSGLAKSFRDGARKTVTKVVLLIWIAGLGGGIGVFLGGKALILAGGAVVLVFIYYGRMANREFGGITGDLAGWFLQVAELAALLVLAAGGHGL